MIFFPDFKLNIGLGELNAELDWAGGRLCERKKLR
jgi:hypothetical protein